MLTITLGVAALVSINSYRANAVRSVRSEARALLGADLRLSSNRPLPDSVAAAVDSLLAAGEARGATVISTLTVVVAPNGRSRLSQLRGVAGPYPFYGRPSTVPAGAWGSWGAGRALVEPARLQDLGIRAGDTLRIGRGRFVVAAVITDLPPELSFQDAFGPRIYIARQDLEAPGVLAFGSLARHQLYLEVSADDALQRVLDARRDLLARRQV
ncbi:MAG: hypothetical protein FIB01_16285, partial [Gemmatimonadetes bacterium]|nr:hypothetical protein [Gemmatimonadota bacterium]